MREGPMSKAVAGIPGALFAGMVALLVTTACSEHPTSAASYLDDPVVAAELRANDYCVPTLAFSDGLGGLNSMAYAYGGALRTLDDCGPPPDEDPYPNAPGIWAHGWDYNTCFSGFWDIDDDGVHNGCENGLAQYFAPELRMTSRCDWDYALDRMGGEYYFAVQAGVPRVTKAGTETSDIRIAYLPAYYIDCGGFFEGWCELGMWGCAPHSGDSEFFIVDVSYDFETTHWVTDAIFLSAHCHGGLSDDCNWQDIANFEWRDGKVRGAPVIWVSENKHANYYSQDDCDAGGGWGPVHPDECDFTNQVKIFPVVYGQQNIGSRSTPLRDCDVAFSGSPMTDPNKTECMWRRSLSGRFNGWQSDTYGDPPTLYTDILSTYVKF
jgi:hypothetical protein